MIPQMYIHLSIEIDNVDRLRKNLYDKIHEFNIAISNYSLCIAIKRLRILNGNQKGQSRETGNIGYTTHKTKTNKTKTQHNMYWTPLYANKHK